MTGRVMRVSPKPTLHLTVGLPGVGKTTLARELEQASGALRLTPDEWMVPLFGLRWTDFGGKRDVLEGRLIWVAHQVLRAGVSVILDFGCWSPEERYALRAIAAVAGADFELHYLVLPEDERKKRATARWRESPEEVFEMSPEDHEAFFAQFSPPTVEEVEGRSLPAPPTPFETWFAWASDRWPSLPRLDRAY
jgi:predicted kinase